MADDLVYENVPVSVRKREGQGLYEFGVVLDGAFIVFGGRKTGGVDDDIARARQNAKDEADAAAQAQAKADADARVQQATQPVNPTPPSTSDSPDTTQQ